MDLTKIATVTNGRTRTNGVSPFSEIEISKVFPNPNQPRKTFIDIEELANTIKEHGLLQPITVVKKDNGYMIVSGERRYKAHLHNKAKTIKAYILNATDEEIEELTLIENIQRNDLTDFETAKYIIKLWETGRYSKKSELSKKLGKVESYVSKAFSSMKLDSEILKDIEQNKKDIPLSVMDEISRVKDKTVQKEVYQKYSDGEITRDEIKEYKEPKDEIKTKRKLLNTFIYEEPLRWEDGTTLQSEFVDKNLPFENIDIIGRGYYGNRGAFCFDDINASFSFHNIKIGDYMMTSDSNEKYNLTITKVEELEDDLLLENELSITGEVHPESFSCLEFKQINAYFYYNNLSNPEDFQGFKKGERYKLVLKKIKNKAESHNEKFSKEFTASLKDLVKKPRSSTENFPAGNNLKVFEVSIYGDNNILYETISVKAKDKESALKSAHEKYPNEAEDENFYFEIFDIEELKASFKVDVLVPDRTEILEARIKELEKEIKELNNKEVFIVGYSSRKGSTVGGGFRCRALNENEAIEIAKKENYHNLANDKNIIWEARTLKSGCNEGNIFDDHIGYGFGTVNDIGTYIAVIDGDFEATITFKKNGDFIKNTNNKEYQVIIKEIETPKNKSIKKENKTVNKKTISLLELFEEIVTIVYTDNDMDMGLDYNKAKKIIDESNQDSIPFDVCKGTIERAYRLIDEKTRTIKDDCIVLIHK